MPQNPNAALLYLKREFQALTWLGTAVLPVGFARLGFTRDWVTAGQWFIQAGLLWLYVCLFLKSRLALNRATQESALYETLGWGNRLTLLRGGLIALTGGFLFIDQAAIGNSWAPALLYTLAAILDRFDGFVARRNRQVSLLGNELDISFDALGLVIAPLLAISWGQLHASYLLLSVAYYAYQWGMKRRSRLGLMIYPIPPNPLRRTLAGFQMGFVATALWLLLDPALTRLAGMVFMLPVLFGFVVDWLVVCGYVPAKLITRLVAFSELYFQPGLRVLVLALLIFAVPEIKLFEFAGLSFGLLTAWLGAGFILSGFAGRFGALVLIFWLGWQDTSVLNSLFLAALMTALSWILLLGTGRFSLWQWGDEWLVRYDGA